MQTPTYNSIFYPYYIYHPEMNAYYCNDKLFRFRYDQGNVLGCIKEYKTRGGAERAIRKMQRRSTCVVIDSRDLSTGSDSD